MRDWLRAVAANILRSRSDQVEERADGAPAPVGVERIGLLFVHGIGEQKRFEFLRSSVVQFAELMKQSGGEGEVFGASVVDRTADWKLAHGEPHPDGLSPVTLTLASQQRRLVFECHEVWWADLGARTGIADTLTFWFWGIGQWLAPIYRDLDAADLQKLDHGTDGQAWNKVASKLVKLPEAVAGRVGPECLARVRLAMAALATLFVVVSWVVLKRLFSAILNKAPSPTLLVSYVGDVRTFEERARPGDAALSDPGHPRRVGIRRRMVTEMVAMGVRDDLDRWYVVAHSQGTVLAYNGLTEIGHALPNYLPREQWQALPGRLKRDPGCEPRPASEIASMMPARPSWLEDGDVINRPALFRKLRGFLTYGSPLNKFAAIWPRIVATATDRRPGAEQPFGTDCRWINLRALQDPVAGNVERFFNPRPGRPGFAGCIPPIHNVDAPFRPNFLISHLRYFDVGERFARRMAVSQRHGLMRWMMTRDAEQANHDVALVEQPGGRLREILVDVLYVGLLGLLAALAIGTVTLGGDLLRALFGRSELTFIGWAAFAFRMLDNAVPVLATAATLLVMAGYLRWMKEVALNIRLAQADRLPLAVKLLRAQLVAACACLVLICGIAIAVSLLAGTIPRPLSTTILCLATLLAFLGITAQSCVNWLFGTPLRYASTSKR
jgi:hypothetical protein